MSAVTRGGNNSCALSPAISNDITAHEYYHPWCCISTNFLSFHSQSSSIWRVVGGTKRVELRADVSIHNCL